MILRSGVQKARATSRNEMIEIGNCAEGDSSRRTNGPSPGIKNRPEIELEKQLRIGNEIEDRALLMVALNEFIVELKSLSAMDVIDEELVSTIMELKLIVEPMLLDVQSESKNIQEL